MVKNNDEKKNQARTITIIVDPTARANLKGFVYLHNTTMKDYIMELIKKDFESRGMDLYKETIKGVQW